MTGKEALRGLRRESYRCEARAEEAQTKAEREFWREVAEYLRMAYHRGTAIA